MPPCPTTARPASQTCRRRPPFQLPAVAQRQRPLSAGQRQARRHLPRRHLPRWQLLLCRHRPRGAGQLPGASRRHQGTGAHGRQQGGQGGVGPSWRGKAASRGRRWLVQALRLPATFCPLAPLLPLLPCPSGRQAARGGSCWCSSSCGGAAAADSCRRSSAAGAVRQAPVHPGAPGAAVPMCALRHLAGVPAAGRAPHTPVPGERASIRLRIATADVYFTSVQPQQNLRYKCPAPAVCCVLCLDRPNLCTTPRPLHACRPS